MHPRVGLAVSVVGLVLLAGCSPDEPVTESPVEDVTGTPGEAEPEPQDPDATEPQDDAPEEPEPVEEEPAEDGFETPEVIDEAYAERVANELMRVETNVSAEARDTVQEGETIPDELLQQLRSIATPEHFAFLATRLQSNADEGFASYPEGPIGDPTVEVEQVLESSSSCLVVGGTLDISESSGIDDEESLVPYFLTLVPGDDVPNEHNPTPWLLANVGADDQPDPAVYEADCA